MSAPIVATIIIVAVVVIALVLIVGTQQSKRRRLRERFGPEYERRIEERGDRKEAERELAEVARQRDRLDVQPVDPQARDRYVAAWTQVQAQFVDQPQAALESADVLVSQVMRDRGYPVDDFDSRAELISADHPGVVHHYRGAHAVQLRDDDVSTEDQRIAFVHYRELFSELVEDGVPGDTRRNGHRAHADRGERR